MTFQSGPALLDACVLSVLCKGDTYGYVLTQNVKEIFDISESSLYPVLRRLQKSSYLTTYDQTFHGRNRRYYSITPEGKQKLLEYCEEWKEYRSKIDQFLLGGVSDEPGTVSGETEK